MGRKGWGFFLLFSALYVYMEYNAFISGGGGGFRIIFLSIKVAD